MRNFARFLVDSLGQVFSASNFAKLSGGKHLASESRSSSLAFNATNGEITLTGADGSISTVNLPIELLLQSANYNSTTKNLTLTTNGGATVVVPLSDLVDLPEIVIASQNPSAPPSTGQKVYFRSDTGGIWLNVSDAWQGPIASGGSATWESLTGKPTTLAETAWPDALIVGPVASGGFEKFNDASRGNAWAIQSIDVDGVFDEVTEATYYRPTAAIEINNDISQGTQIRHGLAKVRAYNQGDEINGYDPFVELNATFYVVAQPQNFRSAIGAYGNGSSIFAIDVVAQSIEARNGSVPTKICANAAYTNSINYSRGEIVAALNSITIAAVGIGAFASDAVDIVFAPKGSTGKAIVRQPGGIPGTNEIQIENLSGVAKIRQMNGGNAGGQGIHLLSSANSGVFVGHPISNFYGFAAVVSGVVGSYFLITDNGNVLLNAPTGAISFRTGNAERANLSATGILNVTGAVRSGTYTVATLPSASANVRGTAFVTDSNLAPIAANYGANVAGGGSNFCPVYSNGTNWIIG